jgi:hypothetical protein
MHMPVFEVKNELWLRHLSGLIFAAAVIASCFCPTLAFGQTNSAWNGGTGNWNTATDWTPNGAPNNGGSTTYNVTIDSGGTDSVTLDQNATINSLVLGGNSGSFSTLQSENGTPVTLNIVGGITVNDYGDLNFNSGSNLTVDGTATINGSFAAAEFTVGNTTVGPDANFTLTGVANISTLF